MMAMRFPYRFSCIRTFALYKLWKAQGIDKRLLQEDDPPRKIADIPISKYAGRTTVTLLSGSKVGDEGSKYISTIFDHLDAPIILEYLPNVGNDEETSNEQFLSLLRNGTAIHIDTIHETRNKAMSLMINNKLDLYACVVNCFSIQGYTQSEKFKPLDITVIMQNNRGDFSKLEYEPVKGVVETIRVCNRRSLRKYIEFAFKYAITHKRKKITFGHKLNEVPLSDGLHIEVAKRLHKEKFPNIEVEYLPINQLTLDLMTNPHHFDVICLNDKYGTFITSIASALCGGVGLFSSTEIGERYAIFKPLQTKLSITDSEKLCPYGTILTTIALLQHLNYTECANVLAKGLHKVMIQENIQIKDWGGPYCEEDVVGRLLEVLEHGVCQGR